VELIQPGSSSIDWFAPGEDIDIGREVVNDFTVQFISGADFQSREHVQDIETGNDHTGETVDSLAERAAHTVKPPQRRGRRWSVPNSWARSGIWSPKTASFSSVGKWTAADTGAISFIDTENNIHFIGPMPVPMESAAGNREEDVV